MTEISVHSHQYQYEDPHDVETKHLIEEKSGSPFSRWPHVFNLANSIVGVSVLAMPFVFQQCGILLAVLMIGACAVLTKNTCHFLSKASFQSSKHSYDALALKALGSSGRRFVQLCLLSFLISSIVAFLVVIGDIGPHLVADYLELEAPTQRLRTLTMVVVLLLVIFPLSLIKDLEKFSIISSFAVLFYGMFVIRMILEALPTLWNGEWSIHVVWWRPAGFLTCFPIVCMALSCQTQLFCVIDCIRDATVSRVDGVVSCAVNFCSAMYAGVGLFGYVAFFSRTLHGDVLVELESSFLTQLFKLAFMLSIAISIPLMLFPARITLFNLLLRSSRCELPVSNTIHFSTFHVLTFVILFFNLTIALLIPNVEFVLGLTGSLIGSLTNIIIPSVLFIAVIDSKKERYIVSYAKICLVVGCFILLVSTWATLKVDRMTPIVEKFIFDVGWRFYRVQYCLSILFFPRLSISAIQPMPKDGSIDKPALRNLEKLEEKVLDANLNISAKLDSIAGLAAIGKDKEAANLLMEMKQERKVQKDLIKKQKKIVQELYKYVEVHAKDIESQGKGAVELNEVKREDYIRKKDHSVEAKQNAVHDNNEDVVEQETATRITNGFIIEQKLGEEMVHLQRNVNHPQSPLMRQRKSNENGEV